MYVENAEPSSFQTAVQSREQTRDILEALVGYIVGCWLRNNEHCSKNPLHLAGLRSNFSFLRKSQMQVYRWLNGRQLRLAVPIWRPCSILAGSSISKVRCLSCWWWIAWMVTSVVSVSVAAGSWVGKVFCNDALIEWGSICSFILCSVVNAGSNNSKHNITILILHLMVTLYNACRVTGNMHWFMFILHFMEST